MNDSNLNSRSSAGLERANFAETVNKSSQKYGMSDPNPIYSMTQKRRQNSESSMTKPSDPMQAFMHMMMEWKEENKRCREEWKEENKRYT